VEDLLAREIPDVDLRAVAVGGRPGAGVLQIVIAHPVRVDHELCVRVTRVLDDAGLRDRYAVEVSSPGPEPPLRVTSHYLAAIGEQVKLAIEPGTVPGSSKSVSGTLTGVTDESLTVDTPAGVLVVPRDAVRRARMLKKAQCGE
jgi:ribosome maturation factor RimP